MSTLSKAAKAERAEAIAQLRDWIKPGDTVYTILDHVSSSGMSRAIRVVLLDCTDGKADARHPNWAVGKALQLRHWKRNGNVQDALVMGGCGMDMGFALVYELSHTLYGDGYACLGKGKCPSNYHTNHRAHITCPTCYGHKIKIARTEATLDQLTHWPESLSISKDDETGAVTYDHPFAWLSHTEDGKVCTACGGRGTVDNPDGPERFDLVHTDGYALRHRWL